jgi:hypothetical protein
VRCCHRRRRFPRSRTHDALLRRYVTLGRVSLVETSRSTLFDSGLGEKARAMTPSRFNAVPPPSAARSPLEVLPTVAPPVETATIYTCPMHPLLRHSGPGNCPICGMSLEVLVPKVGGDDSDPELLATTRRLWLSIALTLPLLLIAMHVTWPFDLSAWVDAASGELGWPRVESVTASSGPACDDRRRVGRRFVLRPRMALVRHLALEHVQPDHAGGVDGVAL